MGRRATEIGSTCAPSVRAWLQETARAFLLVAGLVLNYSVRRYRCIATVRWMGLPG